MGRGLGIGALALLASLPAIGRAGGWAEVEALEGEFAVVFDGAPPDPKASPLIRSTLDAFVAQGRFTAARDPAHRGSRLFRGRARGTLLVSAHGEVLGGTAARGATGCAGAFDGGDVTVELMLDEGEYQVYFQGTVPDGKVSIRYPMAKVMARVLEASARAWSASDDATFQFLAREAAGAQQEFEAAARDEERTQGITFSASTVPEWRPVPGSRFKAMHFLPLPAGGTVLAGDATLELVVSTAVLPTVVKARAKWVVRGR